MFVPNLILHHIPVYMDDGNINSSCYNFYGEMSAILLSLGEDLVDVDPSIPFFIDIDGDKGCYVTSDTGKAVGPVGRFLQKVA
jgi:hypothetical protein